MTATSAYTLLVRAPACVCAPVSSFVLELFHTLIGSGVCGVMLYVVVVYGL